MSLLILAFSTLIYLSVSENLVQNKYHLTLLESSKLPKISLTFPDGTEDTLILNHNDIDEDCNYFGHLKNNIEACVAVTGCAGKDPLVITIAGKDGGMFELSLDGQTKQISDGQTSYYGFLREDEEENFEAIDKIEGAYSLYI